MAPTRMECCVWRMEEDYCVMNAFFVFPRWWMDPRECYYSCTHYGCVVFLWNIVHLSFRWHELGCSCGLILLGNCCGEKLRPVHWMLEDWRLYLTLLCPLQLWWSFIFPLIHVEFAVIVELKCACSSSLAVNNPFNGGLSWWQITYPIEYTSVLGICGHIIAISLQSIWLLLSPSVAHSVTESLWTFDLDYSCN